jgi:large subunit ribosomal protein L21
MYAIVETGGKQYRVKPGDTVAVERLSGEPGDTLDLDRVLLIAGNGDDEARVGSPGVNGAVVRAEVVDHIRGEKIIVFRYKSKVRYRRKTGHRQSLTRLKITDILLDGASALPREEARSQQAEPTQEPEPIAPVAAPTRRRRAAAVAPEDEPTQEPTTTESPETTESVDKPEHSTEARQEEHPHGT